MKTFCGLTTDGMLDYLATIYRLDGQLEKVTTGALAERMYVSAAAASSMLKRLEESNLVDRSSTDGVILTQQGHFAALQLLRRHRLLEVFLLEIMGFSWDQVDVEAHRLEHSVSSAFEERMDRLCNYPQYCPHGDPIPDKDGRMPADKSVCLLDLPQGSQACIRRVATDDPRILRYLSRLELIPGQAVAILDIAPFNGPVTLDKRGAQAGDNPQHQVLGYELAQLLFVEPLILAQQKEDPQVLVS